MTSHSDSPIRQSGHLDYYRSQGISPVRYEMSSLEEHFDRRDAVYRAVGLPQVAFRGCRVLEVAPGSGQNSLFIAHAGPLRFDLVEPNPKAIDDIRRLYADHGDSVTIPTLHPVTLEEFRADTNFDIVICENWLGSRSAECQLIGKLASLVAPGGALVLTMVPYTGFFPNVCRRLLSLRINNTTLSFDDQTRQLVEAFGPHLGTIPNMTRSHIDWVHDCMLNPHYLNVVLPFQKIVEAIGNEMEFLGSSPKFTTEWRWFKGLVGETRQFNHEFLRSYTENSHNFVDYRHKWLPRIPSENQRLEMACRALHSEALKYEASLAIGGASDGSTEFAIAQHAATIGSELKQLSADLAAALDEFGQVWATTSLSVADIAGMKSFSQLFGRETVYLAFTRRRV